MCFQRLVRGVLDWHLLLLLRGLGAWRRHERQLLYRRSWWRRLLLLLHPARLNRCAGTGIVSMNRWAAAGGRCARSRCCRRHRGGAAASRRRLRSGDWRACPLCRLLITVLR